MLDGSKCQFLVPHPFLVAFSFLCHWSHQSPSIAPAGAAPGTESRPGTTQEPKAALALQPHCFLLPVDTGVRVSAPASCEWSCTSSCHSLGRGRALLGDVLRPPPLPQQKQPWSRPFFS